MEIYLDIRDKYLLKKFEKKHLSKTDKVDATTTGEPSPNFQVNPTQQNCF